MFKILAVCIFISTMGCANRPVKNVEEARTNKVPNIVFTITEGIAHPESAIYSEKEKAIFVSNIVSGNPVETRRPGTISKHSPDGKVINPRWVSGLKAPKGMTIVGGHLFVSDVNQVVKINIKTGKILETVTVKGAKFLNDVTSDSMGKVYVSDMMTDTIHVWDKAGIRTWLKTPKLRSPNGLLVAGSEHILLASWGNPINPKDFTTEKPGALSALSLKKVTSEITEEKSIRGNLDGITIDNSENVWISDWMNGDVYKVQKNGEAQKIYNFSQGTADITFAKELNLLLIPQMKENKVLAIKVE